MLYVATVNEPPPCVEARAATGGALLLLAMATRLVPSRLAAVRRFLQFGCEAAKAVHVALIQNGYKNYRHTSAPGPRGATGPPQISQPN
jgi:hypothetical protein